MIDDLKVSVMQSDLPEGWSIDKFKYALGIWKGLSITKADLADDGIPVVSYGQVHSKFGKSIYSTDELPFLPLSYSSRKTALLKKGDFIFADTSEDIEGSGNFTTKLDDGMLLAGYHSIIARIENSSRLSYRYTRHLFDSMCFRNQIRETVSGIKVYSITQFILGNTKIIIPPLNEQEKIATHLDEIEYKLNQTKDVLEKQIEKLKEYRKSIVWETVTKGLDSSVEMKDSGIEWIGKIPKDWKIKRLKDLVRIQTGGTPKESVGVNQQQNGTKWYKPGDFKDNSIFLTQSENYIEDEVIREKKISIYPPDTVLIVGIASIGKVGISEESSYSNQQITALLNRGEVESKYLAYVMAAMSDFIKDTALYTVVPIINNQYLSTLMIPFPTLEYQKNIIEYLDTKKALINKIIENKQKQIDVINEQKKTLIYDYVTGKRRVE